MISNWRCLLFRANTPGADIDNLRQKSAGRELFKRNFGKRKNSLSRQHPGSLKIYLNSSGPPSAWLFDSFELIACPGVMLPATQ